MASTATNIEGLRRIASQRLLNLWRCKRLIGYDLGSVVNPDLLGRRLDAAER